jgi:hypothetical protein
MPLGQVLWLLPLQVRCVEGGGAQRLGRAGDRINGGEDP